MGVISAYVNHGAAAPVLGVRFEQHGDWWVEGEPVARVDDGRLVRVAEAERLGDGYVLTGEALSAEAWGEEVAAGRGHLLTTPARLALGLQAWGLGPCLLDLVPDLTGRLGEAAVAGQTLGGCGWLLLVAGTRARLGRHWLGSRLRDRALVLACVGAAGAPGAAQSASLLTGPEDLETAALALALLDPERAAAAHAARARVSHLEAEAVRRRAAELSFELALAATSRDG